MSVLVDANILLYATDESSTHHELAAAWLQDALTGEHRVGLPWQSLTAFLRIVTNPRAVAEPLGPIEAWDIIDVWLSAAPAWIPSPGPRHAEIMRRLMVRHDIRGALVTDAALAGLCVEYGLTIVSADSDFARFTEVAWQNPVAR